MANKFRDKFISAMERRERVLTIMPAKGFASINQLAEAAGMTWSALDKSLRSESVSAASICKIAMALDVSVKYLLER